MYVCMHVFMIIKSDFGNFFSLLKHFLVLLYIKLTWYIYITVMPKSPILTETIKRKC